ncbi:hypothetical protein [Neisseria sp.]|uniref:hypothetical protein n=1 Tax=Neisseria sp. TaxID=192066 RepID=UPI00359F7070
MSDQYLYLIPEYPVNPNREEMVEKIRRYFLEQGWIQSAEEDIFYGETGYFFTEKGRIELSQEDPSSMHQYIGISIEATEYPKLFDMGEGAAYANATCPECNKIYGITDYSEFDGDEGAEEIQELHALLDTLDEIGMLYCTECGHQNIVSRFSQDKAFVAADFTIGFPNLYNGMIPACIIKMLSEIIGSPLNEFSVHL